MERKNTTVDRDVILAKVQNIKNYLKRIHETVGTDAEKLENFPEQDVFVLNVQRAVQSAIDIATHIVSTEQLGLPRNLAQTFELLEGYKHIPKDLISKMEAMTGFRNIAVHHYTEINLKILKSIFHHHLKDLEDFCDIALKLIPRRRQ